MGPFPPSFGQLYILLAVEYVSKWVEVVVTLTNNAKVVLKFLQKNISPDLEHHEPLSAMKGAVSTTKFLMHS